MAGIEEILSSSGSAARQLFEWAVLQQLIAALMRPALQEVERGVNSISQTTPLSPEQLAEMVVRNIVSHPDGEVYAKQSGISPSDFQRLVQSAGEPPSPQEMLAAVRRGIVQARGTGPDETSLEQAVAESRIYNKYLSVLEALADVPIGVADAVDAAVEGQIPYDQAEHEAFLSGINADRFRILFNTRGNPPSLTELLELVRRGLIPVEGTGPDATTFQQGIFEGATKDKWEPYLVQLGDYVVPPRTVTAMVREGSLTDAQALAEWQKSGLTPTLAAAYLTSAHHQKTQAHRDLTLNQVLTLYKDRLIDAAEARQMMAALQFNDADQTFLLDISDFEVLQNKVRAAVNRVHNLYVNHKITKQEAVTTLDGLGVPAAGRDEMLSIWDLERAANVPILTRAEIVDAWYYGVVGTAEATALLEALGWTIEEATILFGIRAKGKQPAAVRP